MSNYPSEEFEVTYEVDDGYAGGSAPHSFSIDPDWFDSDTPDKRLSEMFWKAIEEDFRASVRPICHQEAEFLAWAAERQAEMMAEEDADV